MDTLKKHIKAFCCLLICLPIFSGCNYLEVEDYFNETLKLDSVFSNKRNLEAYLWGTAAYFPEEGAIIGNNYTPGPLATDEGFTLLDPNEFRGMAYVLGLVNATNSYGMDIWGTMYQIIRKANTILDRMDEAHDMTAFDRRDMLGYIHFMRGYAYYNLLMQYGPVVILGDDVMENNEASEYYDKSRATYDESVEYICQELELAAQYLPLDVPINYFGRPTRGAAYGLISRIRLQHASPLFNGEQPARLYFSNWTRSTDQVHYVSQNYDEHRWAVAAVAAKRIIDMGRYSLHTVERIASSGFVLPSNVSAADFPYGAGNIDPYRSYSEMFNGETLASRNPEFVWARMSPRILQYTQHAFPQGMLGGFGGLSVTQKVVDSYYMVDGRDIQQSSSEYPYSEVGTIGGGQQTFSGYRLNGEASRMYNNREMRFYASVGFSKGFWTANSTSEAGRKNYTVDYSINGMDGRTGVITSPDNYTATGYVLKKYIHPDDAWVGIGARRVDKAFPIIRYAEILLSYVEALNNLTVNHVVNDADGNVHSIYRNTEDIKFYFNQVRYRAGLPGITDVEASSKEKMQELIQRERMIEFLFENRRYYDVRRWGIYEDTESELVMGMDVDAGEPQYYTRTAVNSYKARNRVVDRKMVFLPINLNEIRKTPSLDQNPGWFN